MPKLLAAVLGVFLSASILAAQAPLRSLHELQRQQGPSDDGGLARWLS